MTFREAYAVFAGHRIRSTNDAKMRMFQAWWTGYFFRAKKMKALDEYLRKLEPAKVQSPKSIRASILEIAKTMGAKVRYVKKGEL